MKQTTIHLSLPSGSARQELHVQVSDETLAWLSELAAAAGTPITTISSHILAANRAAARSGQPDMKIEFVYWQPDAKSLAATRRDLQSLASRLQSVRTACLSSTPPADLTAAALREQRLSDLAAALKEVSVLLAALATLARANSSALVAHIVTRALNEPRALTAPAPALGAPNLPPGLSMSDLERVIKSTRTTAATNLTAWLFAALAHAALGREFTVPRPPEPPAPKPTPPSGQTAPKPAPAAPPTPGVDGASKPEGTK